MSENTAIEWADHTFNPWIGCTKISPACDHCYAERWDNRLHQGKHWGPGAERKLTSPANWAQPLKWNREAAASGTSYRVFCASLADVFDNDVPAAWRFDLFDLIRTTPHLDWLLLTKRIGRALECVSQAERAAETDELFDLSDWLDSWVAGDPPANVWLGATVVNQEEVDRDVPKLLATPAAVRFLSCEPLLGSLNVTAFLKRGDHGMRAQDPMAAALLAEGEATGHAWVRPAIDWVIAGGESGPQARPSHPDWFRSLRDQCVAAGVPFLFKQWGEWVPVSDDDLPGSFSDPACADFCCIGNCGYCGDLTLGSAVYHKPSRFPDCFPDGSSDDSEAVCNPSFIHRVGKKAAGRHLDGRTWDQFPESRGGADDA